MGQFRRIDTSIEGLCLIEPQVWGDERGFFMESYSCVDFEAIGVGERFVQDNHSRSRRGVLRGLHFQKRHTQGKLVRVTAGAALDVAVDLRPESPTFGRWEKALLSAENRMLFYVPPRFAHGFLTLEEGTEFMYKCTDYYDPDSEDGVMWNDPALAIDWEFGRWGIDPEQLTVSAKDLVYKRFDAIDQYKLWL
ncbi:MAG: dTDP-4-dehydrorhamnose 3,5-epimerase [Rikenellaceae bacterium]|jgi:dTDP-4-dehydrorhamnose 3,5-epimerase|nr:dTDP-4-dehydrorhamnose 3,5-epimerase [Rikenellaceae bacterium]